MEMCARAVALCCAAAVLLAASAGSYTVDCNHEYTDCDTELSKLAEEDEIIPKASIPEEIFTSTTSIPTTTQVTERIENKTEKPTEPDATEEIKPKPRLLNLSVDELQNFANALHNQTDKNGKRIPDLSDVNLDDDEDESPRIPDHHSKLQDKFFSNLQAPFHTLISNNGESEEIGACKENEIGYKIGEKIDRGCEETCECMPNGRFECLPRCKHPYIRRGRRLNDPLCFESPVDDCCSIIACATGNDQKPTKIEVCKYNNATYTVGTTWHIGCDSSCNCEPNSVVTCKPRCKPLPPSDKCINVQDPMDSCCEIQVCDVSQDAHELPENVTTTTSSTTTERIRIPQLFEDQGEGRSKNRPLVLSEPIGSVKVLQNNSVQVNFIHMNSSEDPIHLLLSDDGGRTFQDVELVYSNLILNLEGGRDYVLKTKETDTKYNFTITSTDGRTNEVEDLITHLNTSKDGCMEDGVFYNVGEEFRIGCSELCECTGPNTRDCATLVCPNHVGLEIMSKGCVKWAPSPPAKPPNCCPRSARCLSDGTCHYNGVPVQNWSEVPIALTGCEQRCFCENGDLDCQEVCSPLPPVPPQNFRCPPQHRPAPVNISDEDCCKQWGCLPIARRTEAKNYSMPVIGVPTNYVTPTTPYYPADTTQVLPPPHSTDPIDSHINSIKTYPKIIKTKTYAPSTKYTHDNNSRDSRDNVTVFTLEDMAAPFKTAHSEPSTNGKSFWLLVKPVPEKADNPTKSGHTAPDRKVNFSLIKLLSDQNIDDSMRPPYPDLTSDESVDPTISELTSSEEVSGNPNHTLSQLSAFNYFLPTHEKGLHPLRMYQELRPYPRPFVNPTKSYFEPVITNRSQYVLTKSQPTSSNSLMNSQGDRTILKSHLGKHVTVLGTKDLKTSNKNEGNNVFWSSSLKNRVIANPSPYETVILKAVPSPTPFNQKLIEVPSKTYDSINLENLLNQMDVQSEVNRNLGRSTNQNKSPGAGPNSHVLSNFPPQKSQPPSFLPTIPPELHFPQDEDYDQNNIHRPAPGSGIPGLPPGIQVPNNFGEMNKKLSVISIESDSPTSITMLLGLPPVLVGLRGSVDLRYTDKADEDVSHWYSEVFAPADEVLTTPRLEFRLTGLRPSTTYKVKGKLYLHNLPVSPESETFSVRTQDLPLVTPVEEKRREINSGLRVVDANDTTAHVTWRHFSEDELQFIDGIQVRYRPVGTPIYSMTELLHHSRSAAELHELRPGSRYEASLVLIPPPRATTELIDPGRVEFTTLPYIDPYNWTVVIEARAVGAEAAELTWHGVPSPAERWVRVYRAAHACGNKQAAGKEHDEFRLAARDQPPSVTFTGLQPETRCRVWLELFLTNGKVKTSNVLEIMTKSLDTDNPIDNEIEASSQSGSRSGRPRGDYYTALVGVGVVAALGALTSLLLLLVVVRRHRPRSVPITPVPTAPRESSLPPYDNPAYKLELQQETMDL